MKRWLFLLNRSAGTLAAGDANGTIPEVIQRQCAEIGIEPAIESPDGASLQSTARQAALSGRYDAVIGGGGDGTLNAVASGLLGTGVAFGVLPLGTHNHFAKDIQMPLDVPEALRALASADVRPLPVGSVNGHIFLNFSAIGFHPEIIRHREAQRRALGRRKWMAMVVAFARTLLRLPMLRVRLTTGGESFVRRTPSVIVCNNPHQMRVFGVENASVADRGLLNVYLAQHTGRLGLVGLFVRAAFRILEPTSRFQVLTVPNLTLNLRRRYVHVSIDGEIVDMSPPLEYRVVADELKVLLPARRVEMADRVE